MKMTPMKVRRWSEIRAVRFASMVAMGSILLLHYPLFIVWLHQGGHCVESLLRPAYLPQQSI